MTENQRDYLADLAGRKGIRLSDTDDWSVSKASEEIEQLKAMPDVSFDTPTVSEDEKIDTMVAGVLGELNRWGFERREG